MTPTAILHSNQVNTRLLIQQITKGMFADQLNIVSAERTGIYSSYVIEKLIQEQEQHEHFFKEANGQLFRSLSGGEQKKALLQYLLNQNYSCLILDNPFDHLDTKSVKQLHSTLELISAQKHIIILTTRKADIPNFITKRFIYDNSNLNTLNNNYLTKTPFKEITIPEAISKQTYAHKYLIECHNISVTYNNTVILNNINWQIKPGDFWELTGANGSGKTTLLSMITGDNVKGYGQELYIFGSKKGSGESVWDIKQKIGYFTTNLTQQFDGRYTVKEMIIGGFFDAVGLYNKPTTYQEKLADQWIAVLNLEHHKQSKFQNISLGQQRMVMIARAMVKHPLLLILDEPTTGLDDANAALLVKLVNKIALESNTSVLYVSHRKESGLKADKTFILEKTKQGSTGKIEYI